MFIPPELLRTFPLHSFDLLTMIIPDGRLRGWPSSSFNTSSLQLFLYAKVDLPRVSHVALIRTIYATRSPPRSRNAPLWCNVER